MKDISGAALTTGILRDFEALLRHVSQWREVELIDVEVTMPQAKCLFVAALHPGISISALASHLRVGLPAASGLVDRLVENGYLQRHEDPRDRRQQLVTLTQSGRDTITRLHELSADRLRQLLAGMSTHELEALRVGIGALEREARDFVPAPVAAATDASPASPERTPA